ncbi:hypothetical protein FMM68_04025 [Lachnospiraceae bacterium MD329]|nr:hypothetical protein [Lachnospiraceae bacterium MD329]
MAYNNNNTLNVTELMTGKDCRLFVQNPNGADNILLAEINEFKVIMTVNSVQYQPVGSLLEGTVPTGVTFDLTFTEAVIRDDVIMSPLLKAIQNGYIPVYHFQGANAKFDGSGEERMTFNYAMPNGQFGLMNAVPGEVVKREQSYRLNAIPRLIAEMASKYLPSVA